MTDIRSLSDDELRALAGMSAAPPASSLQSLSDDELLSLARQGGGSRSLPVFAQTPMDTAADVSKSAGVGLVKGATGLAGMVGTFGGLFDDARYGAISLAGKGLEKAGVVPQGNTDKFVTSLRNADSPEERAGTVNYVLGVPVATGKGFDAIVQSAAGPYYEPKTKLGKYTETTAEFIPGAVAAPGGMAGNALKFGIIPGLASEAAGQATEGTKLEPYARPAAALVAGGIGALATRPGIETRMTAQATRGATEADLAAATQLMRDAQGRGVQLTWAEALQQVTNGATQAGRLQRIVESTPEGGSVLGPAMAQRPDQIRGAVNASLDRIAPASEPTRTAMRGQEAASRGLADVNSRINALEDPYYRAANTRTVPVGDLRFISQDPAFQQALTNVRGDAIRNKDVASFGANEVPTLIAVRKELARMEQNALNPGVGLNPDRELARGITPIRDRLDAIITQHAPEYGQALGVGAGLREQVLNPLQRGPVGQIAQAERLPQQVEALFPARPMEGTARETSRAVGVLNGQDAAAAPALARQHLASTFAEAAQNNIPGANQWGGAKWAAQIAGNPLQRQVLDSNLAALPNGAQVSADVRGLLQVLEATGKREAAGSKTAFNASDLKDLASGGLLSAGGDAVRTANPLSFMKQVKENIDRRRLGARSENIARGLLAQPEEAAALLRTARERSPEGAGARAMLGLLMSSSPALPERRSR